MRTSQASTELFSSSYVFRQHISHAERLSVAILPAYSSAVANAARNNSVFGVDQRLFHAMLYSAGRVPSHCCCPSCCSCSSTQATTLLCLKLLVEKDYVLHCVYTLSNTVYCSI